MSTLGKLVTMFLVTFVWIAILIPAASAQPNWNFAYGIAFSVLVLAVPGLAIMVINSKIMKFMTLRSRQTRILVGRYLCAPVAAFCIYGTVTQSKDAITVAMGILCISLATYFAVTAWLRWSWCASDSIDIEESI